MQKSNSVPLFPVLLALAGLIGNAGAADLEGALQYPPLSIGEDAQPPPPAIMVPPVVSPWRIELGVSGSTGPPGKQQFFMHPPIRWEGSGPPTRSNAGGG